MEKPPAILSLETFRFFRELARHNRKEWMDANRERYRAHVVEPLHRLLTHLTPEVLALNPEFDVNGRTGINFSRINRDIRFARDKSPYRAQMYLMFRSRRAEEGDDGQLYVGVSAEGVTAGFRIYGGARGSQLARVAASRALQNLSWLVRQGRRLGRKYESYWYSTKGGEWTRHDGWPTKRAEWERIRGWIVRRKMKPGSATRTAFPVELGRIFRDVFPLYAFSGAPGWKP